MSKKPSINDQIVDILKPQEFVDPEDEDQDENTLAKISAFDENDDQDTSKTLMSAFRKRNAVDVTKVDKKYRGEVVSRAQLDDFMESSEEENEDDDDEGKYATDTDDDENEELEGSEEELEEESGSEEEQEEASDDDDEEMGSEEDEEVESEDEDDQNDSNIIDKSKLLRPEAQGEKVRQGKAVKIQLQLWEKLLEMRIKSQKLLSLANSLPFGDTFDHLSTNEEFSDAVSSTTDSLLTLLDKNRDLQRTLVEQFSESKDLLKQPASRKRKAPKVTDPIAAKRAHIDHIWEDLNTFTSSYTPFRNSVIQKWHDRTKIATNVKSLKTMESQSIVQKIDNILLNRNDLIRKTQIYRGGYEIVGHQVEQPSPDAVAENPSEIPDDDAANNDPFGIPVKKDANVYVAEIYDDSDFYHQLLRELIEFKTSTSSNPQELEQKYQELHALRNKMKKTVDTRASKGRKIRYVVHNKLVNFMAPVSRDDWTDDAKTDLYNSLFDKLMTGENGSAAEKFILA